LSARRDQSTVLWGTLDTKMEMTPMILHTRAGSRGRRKMRVGPVSRWITQQMTSRARRNGGRFMGMDVLVLSTVGRKTGQPRQTTVSWFPDRENAWLIVASADGSAHNPDWYHNLAAHPDEVWIELPQRKLRVTPEQLEGARREACWRRIIQAQPRYASYQHKTDRLLPVIRLVPAATQP
jgi:deazaflavin-dependent oxidoreductase (nitroreductase family)